MKTIGSDPSSAPEDCTVKGMKQDDYTHKVLGVRGAIVGGNDGRKEGSQERRNEWNEGRQDGGIDGWGEG